MVVQTLSPFPSFPRPPQRPTTLPKSSCSGAGSGRKSSPLMPALLAAPLAGSGRLHPLLAMLASPLVPAAAPASCPFPAPVLASGPTPL